MKDKIKVKVSKVVHGIKKLPDKKHHLDFIAALLTIPVLLSVIILNYNNLNNLQKSKAIPTPVPVQTAIPSPKQQFILVPQANQQQNPANSSPSANSCEKDIGPVDITYPTQGQSVTDNPLCIIINYDASNYCSVVWSYSVNGGAWSNYTTNNPCIYNLPNGNIRFNLKVQSTVIQKEEDFTRDFIYNGAPAVSPTPTTATTSASTNY